MRLIDADAFKLYVQRCILIDEDLSTEQIERYLLAAIDGFTEIDAVPVVRCKDCCHSYDDIGGLTCSYGPCVDCIVPEDFCCKHGERKERMTSESNQEKYIIGDCKDFS